MAHIQPFAALRPRPDLARQICELPYDVMSSAEAREIARDNPLSFLHVSKPEIDLDPSISPCDPSVYARGRKNFERLIREKHLVQDARPGFHLYRQIMGSHSQVGLVAAASCQDYENNVIKKHELTRPDKEDDRVRHIESLNAQTGPVFLTCRANPRINAFVNSATDKTPSVDFTAADGVRHTGWSISNPADIAFLRAEFAAIPNLYVADGHHRSAAAVRIWKKRRVAEGAPSGSTTAVPPPCSAFFLAVIFPHDQMQIMPYNRLVKDLNGLGRDRFAQELRQRGRFEIQPRSRPTRKHEICVFLDGIWHSFQWHPSLIPGDDPAGQLDVALLQNHLLAPLLGIADPRTSDRISFVGGIRGTEELEQQVRSGRWAVAFSLYPTGIEDLMQIADRGGIMPPKSTWFEPKLRDAMFCHLLEPST